MSVLTEPHFYDETAAYAFVEARIWANGVSCPHCGNVDADKLNRLKGESTRIGVWKCYACRKPFTVKIGTIFESSHVALHLWLQAIYLIASSKKGISSQQLHRTLGVTLKTAWFMSHRIREAMREGNLGPLGGSGKTVEVDETYYGPAADQQPRPRDAAQGNRTGGARKPGFYKRPIVGLVERGGMVRTFHVAQATKENVASLVTQNVRIESALMTDESHLYKSVGKSFASHDTTTAPRIRAAEGAKVVHSNTMKTTGIQA